MTSTPVNVFGSPVIGKDGLESATKAYNDPNEGDKRSMAIDFVKHQKKSWGTGVATLSIFYNATGQDLNLYRTGSKYGRFYEYPPPPVVKNGQWGAFVHIQQNDVTISEGFVEYTGKIKDTPYFSIELLGWMTDRSRNIIHCDIFPAGAKPLTPEQIYKDIETNPHPEVKKFGMHVIATLTEDGICEYTVTRDDVA